ncbi:transcriptional regulator, GntR family putative [Novosphingobium sp. Rr 2-17]|uniref:FadR/GntR family transcriptional regulator n=1 Tax=Novosphingobium sp. Rr 2-17 TaxID=555793 RepID=UPI00026988E8|nr:GntR family transcriptional regulator [Novosphingobium sp. Rr 2-17]EIZ78181.1 transcriptional regulator, GntR family putative [Novosphingobium sp. Rr 2-17]
MLNLNKATEESEKEGGDTALDYPNAQAILPLPPSLPDDVTQAFTDLLGDSQVPLKGALRTARLIEEQFLADGWPSSRRYGGEAELARRYHAGEAMIREAIRILEARGTAKMRTGRNANLIVTAPPLEQLYDGMQTYCSLLGVSDAEIVTAQTILDCAAARIAIDRLSKGPIARFEAEQLRVDNQDWRTWLLRLASNPSITFYANCVEELHGSLRYADAFIHKPLPSPDQEGRLEQLREAVLDGDVDATRECVVGFAVVSAAADRTCNAIGHVPDNSRLPQNNKRALQIVADLLGSLEPGQWRDGTFIGNEADLCVRYDVDRRSLRQAIRVLEASQVALTVPGRGNGLMACTPKPASFSRLICCHFAASEISRFFVFDTFEALSIETVTYIASRAGAPTAAAPAGRIGFILESCKDNPRLHAKIEDQQFALAGNPLLELFLRSARAYNSLGGIGKLPPTAHDVSGLSECLHQLAKALASHDPTAAANAQARKCAIVRKHLKKAEIF